MSDKSDEYMRNARECKRMAENSLSEADRASWLRLAGDWMRLLRGSRGNETIQADQTDWPDDPDSKTSH